MEEIRGVKMTVKRLYHITFTFILLYIYMLHLYIVPNVK